MIPDGSHAKFKTDRNKERTNSTKSRSQTVVRPQEESTGREEGRQVVQRVCTCQLVGKGG